MRMTFKIGGVLFRRCLDVSFVSWMPIPLRENRSPSCWWVPISVAPAAISTRNPFSIPTRAVSSSAAFRVYVMTGVPSASTLTWPLLSSRVTTQRVTVREKRAILSLKSAAANRAPPFWIVFASHSDMITAFPDSAASRSQVVAVDLFWPRGHPDVHQPQS